MCGMAFSFAQNWLEIMFHLIVVFKDYDRNGSLFVSVKFIKCTCVQMFN